MDPGMPHCFQKTAVPPCFRVSAATLHSIDSVQGRFTRVSCGFARLEHYRALGCRFWIWK